MSANIQEKQLRLMMAAIRLTDYSHPLVLQVCSELKLNHEELKPKDLKEFTDKRTCTEIHELRYKHYNSKRKGKLESIAIHILKMGLTFQNLISTELTPTHQRTHSFSPEQSEKTINKSGGKSNSPITPHELSRRNFLIQKKKLDRLKKVIGNIKNIKYEEEVKKQRLNNEIDIKQKKIEEDKQNYEEKRLKKISEIQAKREGILRKMHNVIDYTGD